MPLRISDSIRIGPFRIRLSAPVTGKGRTWASASVKAGHDRIRISQPIGGRKRGKR